MSYNFDYFSARDLRSPTKPAKPILGRDPTAIEARAWAEALEEYEREFEAYKENLVWYKNQITTRRNELMTQLRIDYGITEGQFTILWNKAWEDGHSEGLERVVDIFEELYSIARDFAALEC
jgi:hypothetical protein